MVTVAGPLRSVFYGGDQGPWRVVRVAAVKGPPLPEVQRLAVVAHAAAPPAGNHGFRLEGVTSHQKYTERAEKEALAAKQAGLGRPEATLAALIPITKSSAWWDLAQDERRAVFYERSRHISASMPFLPAIARRLYHCRELGGPFDFLTWFEYAPQHASQFEELVAMLRETEEWSYVEHEVDLRLAPSDPGVAAR